jgi:hypothetical protein
MLLPMLGFFLALFAVGGLGSLVTMADETRARLFPYTMSLLWCGMCAWIWVFGFGFLSQLLDDEIGDMITFLGIPIAALGGGVLGFVIGSRRNRRLGIK